MKIKFYHLITFVFLLITAGIGAAGTITVDDNGWADHSSIQEAITFAQENDSILIYEGNYSEILTIDKKLKISSISCNPADVIINPNILSQPIIHVTSDNVEITGLTILGTGNENQISGIYLDNVSNSFIQDNIISNVQDGLVLNASSENSIKNNTLLSNNLHGIYLINSKSNNLRNNLIIGNKFGLYLDLSNQNTLTSNNASNNENYGIALRKSNANNLTNNQFFMNKYGLCLTDSHENVVTDNIASSNKQYGFLLWTSRSNNVKDNLLIENENSGIYLLPSCSNNTFYGNTLSNNVNGISIEDSSNNFVINNTFSSNEEHGIFYVFSEDSNIVKGNIFLNNKKSDDNFTSYSTPIYVTLLLLTGAVLAYYLNKKSLLKKVLTGLGILIVISLIVIIAWYFPFESGLPGNNVYIEDIETNITPINETFSRVTLSMNLNYLYKDSFSHTNKGDMTDNLPVIVQVKSSSPADGTYTDEVADLECEENIILQYLETNPYECTFDLKSGTDYYLSINVLLKEELDYPHPYYGELKWDGLGGLLIEVDLK